MLQRTETPVQLVTGGFLIAVEFDPNVTNPDEMLNKISDSLAWVEGTGKVEVDYLGIIPEFEEE